MKKNILTLVICLLCSLIVTFGLQYIFADNNSMSLNNSSSLLSQEIVNNTRNEKTYYKLYYRGQLLGIVNNLDDFYSYIDSYYVNYADEYPGTSLGLVQDVFLVEETSFIDFENIDDKLADYLYNNNLLGIKAASIEFSTSEGVYDIIYVLNEQTFYQAESRFLLNFVSEDTLTRINNNSDILSPSTFETKEMGVKIQEKMTMSEDVVSPELIFKTEEEVYNYFCYGRNTECEYYTTVDGDTLQAVGYRYGDMSAEQVMSINRDQIFSIDQILQPGTVLNVTYFESPITVVVTKQRLAQEIVLPDSPVYKEDESLMQGSREIVVEEKNGLSNVLYEETWVNGVVTAGNVLSSVTVEEAVQGVIAVGSMVPPDVGTGNWGWPVYNPIITCNYTCYYGHGGVDFQNKYNRYDVVLATDNGVVEEVSYTDIGGYYVIINHNNGYKTYYGHMRTRAYVNVGDVVQRGDVLGPIGMTGIATGPHVHLMIYRDERNINPCSILACGLLY